MRRILTRAAIAGLLVSSSLVLHSQQALASATTQNMNACQTECSTGSCSAQTVFWVFWADCNCTCTSAGYPSCSCT